MRWCRICVASVIETKITLLHDYNCAITQLIDGYWHQTSRALVHRYQNANNESTNKRNKWFTQRQKAIRQMDRTTQRAEFGNEYMVHGVKNAILDEREG